MLAVALAVKNAEELDASTVPLLGGSVNALGPNKASFVQRARNKRGGEDGGRTYIQRRRRIVLKGVEQEGEGRGESQKREKDRNEAKGGGGEGARGKGKEAD